MKRILFTCELILLLENILNASVFEYEPEKRLPGEGILLFIAMLVGKWIIQEGFHMGTVLLLLTALDYGNPVTLAIVVFLYWIAS